MAELADAPGLGPGVPTDVEVRILSLAVASNKGTENAIFSIFPRYESQLRRTNSGSKGPCMAGLFCHRGGSGPCGAAQAVLLTAFVRKE